MQARTFYADFVEMVKQKYAADRVHNGEFGAMMDVSLVNDVSPAHQRIAACVSAPTLCSPVALSVSDTKTHFAVTQTSSSIAHASADLADDWSSRQAECPQQL